MSQYNVIREYFTVVISETHSRLIVYCCNAVPAVTQNLKHFGVWGAPPSVNKHGDRLLTLTHVPTPLFHSHHSSNGISARIGISCYKWQLCETVNKAALDIKRKTRQSHKGDFVTGNVERALTSNTHLHSVYFTDAKQKLARAMTRFWESTSTSQQKCACVEWVEKSAIVCDQAAERWAHWSTC